MSRFIIHGQRKLTGTYTPVGNKNAVLPMLAATILTGEPVTLHNVPHILDVQVMLELLESIGVSVEQKGRSVTLQAAKLRKRRLDPELCGRVRSSILLAGPLTARHGRAILYPPGGDVIGRRRLDTHFYGLRALGISVEGGKYYSFRKKQFRGARLLLDEASVTATENVLMAATLAQGITTIFNAACEPHVQDLGVLLNKMGAQIEGLGTNFLKIDGVEKLHGATHTVGPDYIEMGSFIAAAAATGGELLIKLDARDREVPPTGSSAFAEALRRDTPDPAPALEIIERSFEKLGVSLNSENDQVVLSARQKLRAQRDVGQAIPKIEDGPWPAFPSDLMSVAIVLASQVKGSVLFFEKMFESRMYFVDRLIEMGAQIIQCDPHRVLVAGPSKLHGTHLTSPDIRAGMALLVAALCAKGESTIENAQMIDRGYERIEERLQALGADIARKE